MNCFRSLVVAAFRFGSLEWQLSAKSGQLCMLSFGESVLEAAYVTTVPTTEIAIYKIAS